MDKAVIESAKEHFGVILEKQVERVERIKHEEEWIDYTTL